MSLKKRILTASGLVILIFALAPGTYATENAAPTTAAGVFDFGSGFMPPPTPNGTVGMRVSNYRANVITDSKGNNSGNDFHINVLAIGLAYLRMTGQTFLGARYGFAAVPVFFKMDADLGVNAGGQRVFSDSASVFRPADLQVVPIILEWTPGPGLGINTQLMIQAPTGDYDKNRLVSPGTNHWTLSPLLNATYISPGGFEVSSSFQIDINARNPDTDYRSGVEYRHEFAVGQHVGDWTLGIGGYYYRQLSDDDAPGLTRGNRARVIAAGPAVSYFKPGSGLPPVWLHAYKEFDARNRAEGYTVALRTGISF
ncbi:MULTISPECIES: transporter [Pseudomonas syringae group]|uniref:Phenol degradation meta-pathway protein n=2 Tax=Pseudomonas syringae group TaxID=136849 RepID=A0AB37QI26_9PSED|nr:MULTISPECIES: transporter [Pseudomonas syringae group]KGS15339.1 signal peptide protein [Pseudomonas coronafaciens]KPW35722.1 MetA-pathway of phenol degradation superfamily protein [Pseudomonas coronafaciens pv. atropurpurea]KPX32033.1 MetA-pathway of phenol degradation superfamily protein [Pseudomonas coronafaciens pv. garcae]KPZ23430.1 Phenol degradation meta-pathway protein [Pseudomonas coronafaciens pv. zizaniae]RMN26764.1 MetA-pathway of phenol degradation super protein [Pseudomonas co